MAQPYAPVLPKRAELDKIEKALARKQVYTGPLTGVVTPRVVKALQTSLKSGGYYTGVVNGTFDIETAKAVQKAAKAKGTYTGSIDGTLTPAIWTEYRHVLQYTA